MIMDTITLNFENLFEDTFCKEIKHKTQKTPVERKQLKSQAESMKRYRECHNETIICPCGGKYKSYYSHSGHFNTKKHTKYLEFCKII